MNPHAHRRALLAGLVTLLATHPAPGSLAAPPPGSPGIAAPAPVEAADSLRLHLPAARQAPAIPAVPAPRPHWPLILDTADFGFGTSVVFDRIPDLADLNDLGQVPSVRHVVVALPEWPAGYEALQPLGQTLLPEGADLIVVLPGWPPSRAATEAWNYLRLPVRIVLVVDGPPGNRAAIDELNRVRGLERVIADMAYPSRSGFERLQRPLSFRVVKRRLPPGDSE